MGRLQKMNSSETPIKFQKNNTTNFDKKPKLQTKWS